MAAEDFFNRWSRRKAEADAVPRNQAQPEAIAPAPTSACAGQTDPALSKPIPKPIPTMEDVARLTAESDYSGFVGAGVDESVKNSAMKKLFALPNFNVMDGLDIYIGDYSQPDPLPPGMLAGLLHAKALLDPLSQLERPLMTLLDRPAKTEEAGEQNLVAGNPENAIPVQASIEQHAAADASHEEEMPDGADTAVKIETNALDGNLIDTNLEEGYGITNDHSV